MGSHPTVVDWNNDGNHDLLVGDSNGNVFIYRNTNNNSSPVLDGGTFVLNTGDERASAEVADWNGDGKKDLVIGTLTGTVQVYINQNTDAVPSFGTYFNVQAGGNTFDFTTGYDRSAPRVYDWDSDGLKDLMVGELAGRIYYLRNVGTSNDPVFNSAEQLLLDNGSPLLYPGAAPRSRFFIADWNNDGYADIISGGADGKVMLYAALAPEPVSSVLFVLGGGMLALSGLRKKFKKGDR